MSQVDTPQSSATQPAEPKKGSPIRLMVLLGILAIVLTGFLVDLFWMYDQVKAASERLQKAADEMAERPREEGKTLFLTREGVAQAIGFPATTSTVDENGQLIEHYRWWGPLPLQRRYIAVEYTDSDGKFYSGYTISNRNILGQDEEEASQAQQPAPSEAAPVPSPEAIPPNGGVSGPPRPGPITPEAGSSEPAAEKEKTPDDGDKKPTEPADSAKDDVTKEDSAKEDSAKKDTAKKDTAKEDTAKDDSNTDK
jgi:hypothetical protein